MWEKVSIDVSKGQKEWKEYVKMIVDAGIGKGTGGENIILTFDEWERVEELNTLKIKGESKIKPQERERERD